MASASAGLREGVGNRVSEGAEPVGSIEVALSHTARLMERNANLAAEQAAEILKVAPRHPLATLLLGVARRRGGHAQAALATLEVLAREQPNWAVAQYEYALTLAEDGQSRAAIASLQRAIKLKPDLAEAWDALAHQLTASGDLAGAEAARAQHLRASVRDPRLMSAAVALCESRIPEAERLLRQHLKELPTDVAAIRMLAEIAARLGRYRDAESLLARCLELAPDFRAARHNYAFVLHRLGRSADALTQVDRLLESEPHNRNYRTLLAAVLTGIGEYQRAIDLYAEILALNPQQAAIWQSYGHALKTAGRQAEGINAYRRAIELNPHAGEAYWSLANLKTFRFTPQDLERIRSQLARSDLALEDQYHFHFALGKALEDEQDFASSAEHYLRANSLRRTELNYDPARNHAHVERSRVLFTSEFFAARAGWGHEAPDPIFIVGLPRAGSTLLEQILASHSRVEGTMELPDVASIARTLGGTKQRGESVQYPEALRDLTPDTLREFGAQYLARTRIHRKRGTPLFIDKMPNNFAHAGLIHLMLPNAKIIDARRHPLGCCFSGFKQHFARGQNFTYDLAEIGAYYRDYVELMAHFDAVLPGRIHRVFYERLVEDTQTEVRRLLEYCGLEFEPACLQFYENDRAVRTASSEQVRTPIFREGLEQWRHYEPWLAPLKTALGPVLTTYPGVPDFSDPTL